MENTITTQRLMVMLQQQIDPSRLHQLMKLAKLGWWKADLQHNHYVCSDYLIGLLGLDSEILSFEQFHRFIREDYRERIAREFASALQLKIYEQTFPLITPYGEVWVHTKLGETEKINDNTFVWGCIQRVDNHQESESGKVLEKINALLYQQKNISHSLFSFLQTEDSTGIILKILQELLEQFNGSRAYIIEYNWQNDTQKCTFEVNANGVSPQQDNLDSLPLALNPWWTKQILANNPILLFNLDELPPEAQFEKEFLAMQEIKSMMVIPMIAKDYTWGYLGIDIVDKHRQWSNEDYQWFATMGNIISICMELHRAKIKAQKEQQYFKNLYEYMPIAYARMRLIYSADGEPYDYRFIDLNPAFEKITGCKISDYQNRTARELHLAIDIDQQIKEMVQLKTQNHFQQINFESKEDNRCFHSVIYSPEENEIITLFSDITDGQRAHEALNRSEKELRNIYQNIPVGIELYDKNGYLRDMNDKDVEIFGLQDKNDALGVNLFENPNIPDDVKQQIRKQKNVDFQIKYNFTQIKDYYNTEAYGVKDLIVKLSTLYDAENRLENYMMIIIDNTETLTAASKIQEFESFFSVIADFAKVGYFKWNPITLTGFALDQWFKNWSEPEGARLEDVIGIYRTLHPDDRKKIADLFHKLSTGKIDSLKEEVRVKDGNGNWKWIRSTAILKRFDPTHNDIEVIGVNFDITELKETEAKLIEAKNKAEMLDRLKSAFLANMSHEIRTPLNAIVGFSNLLAETDDHAEQLQFASIIQENNDLLLQLISDILDLSKIEAGTFDISYGDVNVHTLSSEIIRSLNIKTAPGVSLVLVNQADDSHMWSDRNRLTQIITNFINNALKFTSQGYIRLGYEVRGNQIEFYVSDTGIGIPERDYHTIFERFVKLNTFIHGTGLGLSICKSIVEQMGGTIGVDSEEGKGSRFWFIIPYTQSEEELTETNKFNYPGVLKT